MNWDWLKTKEFWSAFTAALALILSQFPPVKQMIKGKRLRFVVANTISLTHTYGNTNMSIWLDIENVGGRTITIGKIACLIFREQVKVQTLTAKTYWLTESLSRDKPVELPITEIALKPGDRWSGYLHLWDTQSWTQEIQSKIKGVSTKIMDDITAKVSQRARKEPNIPSAELPLVETEEKLIQELIDIMKTLVKLGIGDYEIFFTAYEYKNALPLKILGFNITIYEKDTRELFKDAEDYKFGYGIYLPARNKDWVYVEARSMDEKETLRRFTNLS